MRTLVLWLLSFVITLAIELVYFTLAHEPLTHDCLVYTLAITPVMAVGLACIYNALTDI